MSTPSKGTGWTKATFVCALNYLQVRGSLGRGVQLQEEFFVTNDRDIIKGLIDERFKSSMGTLDYHHILESPVVAYKHLYNLSFGSEHTTLVELLASLEMLENVFWLEQDNCIGHDRGFIFSEIQIWTNVLEGIRTFADCSESKSVEVTSDKARDIIRMCREILDASTNKAPITYHTKHNSSRLSRGLNYVSRAQKSAILSEKITFYCTALEALLSTSQSELSHQIAERVAAISASSVQKRMEIYRSVKACYNFRSKFIHGSTLKVALEDLKSTSKELDDIVRKCFEVYFEDEAFQQAIEDEKSLDDYMLRKLFSGISGGA